MQTHTCQNTHPVLRLLFEVTALMRRERTGVAVYVRELATALAQRDDIELRPVWRPSRWKGRRMIADHLSIPSRPFLPIIGRRQGDIYHGPDFRVPSPGRIRRVVTVHDLVVFEDGLVDERFAIEGRAKMSRMIRRDRPDRIAVVSRFTRDRLIEHFPEVADVIHVTCPGIDHRLFTPQNRTPRGRPFLLAAGSIERRKNLERTIAAFECVHSIHSDLRLVIAGGDGFDAGHIHQRAEESSARSAIEFTGYVDDHDLAQLYGTATALLYPSLYEGFGLPVIEGMACGCPVLTSDRGAMAEVAGDAAVRVDPEDSHAIAEGILRLVEESDLRADNVRRGIERASQFRWERCAAATVKAYAG